MIHDDVLSPVYDSLKEDGAPFVFNESTILITMSERCRDGRTGTH